MGQYDDASDTLGYTPPRATRRRMPIAVRYGGVWVPDAPLKQPRRQKPLGEVHHGENCADRRELRSLSRAEAIREVEMLIRMEIPRRIRPWRR